MTALQPLEPFVRPKARPRSLSRCELCQAPLESDHPHVVDLADRNLRCACRACGFLFSNPGAARGKYRTAPDRWLYDSEQRLTDADWSALQIPVRMAFFFRNSELDRWVAFYPGPAGAAESLLGLEAWEELARTSRLAARIEPDVEAILVRGRREGTFECFLVPIHACYELSGHVKLLWKGFDGGEEAWRAIDGFFDRVRARSRSLEGAP